jgi:hypothetical protein
VLDAADVAEQVGVLFDMEAVRRRAVMRASNGRPNRLPG